MSPTPCAFRTSQQQQFPESHTQKEHSSGIKNPSSMEDLPFTTYTQALLSLGRTVTPILQARKRMHAEALRWLFVFRHGIPQVHQVPGNFFLAAGRLVSWTGNDNWQAFR